MLLCPCGGGYTASECGHPLGVLALFDPPRDDAKSTIATAAAMGVKIKMVTGDALAIAKETAKTLGMGANILDGASLGDPKSQETAEEIKSVEDADGFAQVFPEHKFHIVDVLQKHDHIVGMTGDGVNDAPALKKADCGFAVSRSNARVRPANWQRRSSSISPCGITGASQGCRGRRQPAGWSSWPGC